MGVDNFDIYKWNFNRRLLENEENEGKEYEVQYWVYRRDDFDDEYITVKAKSEEEALEKAKAQTKRGKNYKVIK